MLLERLIEKANQAPEFDWEAYYLWQFSQLAGSEVTGYRHWSCIKCQAINLTLLPARYGKCSRCNLIHLPDGR